MSTQCKFFLRMAAVTIIMGSVCGAVVGQAKSTDDRETMQALLTEVRSLRQALQTLQSMSLDTYRSQLLVDRIRVYREDVRRLSASLNETRDLMVKTQITIPQFIERHKLMEAQIQAEADQNKRADLEFEARRVKDAVENYKSEVETYKEREQQLSAELTLQKSKLEELENRLDLLERAIDNERQKLDGEKASTQKPQ